jgi:hypothetical protein
MQKLKTIKEKPGYIYSNGSAGKRWKRGRTMFSEGRQFLGNYEYRPIIAKTNLDTGEITEASPEEYKRFLTEEGYKEYLETERRK